MIKLSTTSLDRVRWKASGLDKPAPRQLPALKQALIDRDLPPNTNRAKVVLPT